jgi:O-6-methylguanine DNA methyltransferase
VTTYSEIAHAIGHPRAVRAVGTAVGRNPVSWLIPCHRAVRKSGGLGGYHWGLPVKRAILARETAALDAAGHPETSGPLQNRVRFRRQVSARRRFPPARPRPSRVL